jgi:hypothetical protein
VLSPTANPTKRPGAHGSVSWTKARPSRAQRRRFRRRSRRSAPTADNASLDRQRDGTGLGGHAARPGRGASPAPVRHETSNPRPSDYDRSRSGCLVSGDEAGPRLIDDVLTATSGFGSSRSVTGWWIWTTRPGSHGSETRSLPTMTPFGGFGEPNEKLS